MTLLFPWLSRKPAKAAAWADLRIAARSETGHVRAGNEDAILFRLATGPEEEGISLFVLADGMGGAAGGEIASSLAVNTALQAFYRTGNANPGRRLEEALAAAGDAIYARSNDGSGLEGMGTTCVALALGPQGAWAAWVGDSRLYLIRAGRIYQMTEDHSTLQEAQRTRAVDADEQRLLVDENRLTRALGSRSAVEIAVWKQPYPVRTGDVFLLCSDGLHQVLTDAEMLALTVAVGVHPACDQLMAEAHRRGSPDNVSLILVEVATPAVEEEARA